ncbi:hypothetical protein EV363DRAFT_1159530 [Boletus edulis]|nr:hypothetical protein EV363DRAFT_1179513 [Boletus edulis]KAF8135407.1 hypothetical protein EV363DRAFT_1159530 [Boletus edulis]
MLESYLKGAKLRSWLSRPDCPTAIRECKILFDQAYRFPDGNLNVSDDAVLRANIKDKTGVVYSRTSTHVGNSLILFYPQGNHLSTPVPGNIKYIFAEGDSYAFAVQRQLPLPPSESKLDPFAAYPHFPAQQYSSVLQTTLEYVRFSWVFGHYARWAISDDRVVVLNLSKVGHPLLLRFIFAYHIAIGLD